MNFQYVIKQGDMALIPSESVHDMFERTTVLKYNDTPLTVKERTQKIIDRSCRFYGSTYAYKKEDTIRITGITSKPPLLFTPLFPTYFFPTHSDRKQENAWVNIHYIESIKPLKDRKCKITFVDKQTLTLNVSAHSINHQFLNTVFYYYMMDRLARVTTFDPDAPIDYSKPQLNIYEALAKYSILEKK
ncbi:competence protein ComK [Staphylococcus auricularis]|uniref:Competence protein ComK n=1 Tax=Staphylococcus auricularis TaxID=29379 RepID=A0AAP8PQ38_9STAP|nr:competence protein ComK [Staphylococcus auricularis]MBM0868831.1 competence protein ComK [Staphylococcus auricularis]MCG7341454.1 competence protein ComK [Staphylococcus auricularis]MDC6326333.1 competence protein ComK [Staphylococcus auricularis]MDN4533778.1 competence protein ComK [Staphylococcus auricularis]PNZ68669.1 competence protein ComK [Staphylococcus auricularis]